MMEILKRYILNFYKTHDKHASMNFENVMKDLQIDRREDLNTFLLALIDQGFIECTFTADNVVYTFCLK